MESSYLILVKLLAWILSSVCAIYPSVVSYQWLITVWLVFFCSRTKKGVLEYVRVHHKLMLWVLEGINGYVKCLWMLGHQVPSSVCNEVSSYRWQSWGAEGNKRWKLNCDLRCVKICCLYVCVSVCVCRCGCFCCLPRSLTWRASIIRAVSLDPHLRYERVLVRQTPIHTEAPPAHLDEQARPFIISLVIPELPASDFYLHYAQETHIHISNLLLFALQWVDCQRGGGRWRWWWGSKGRKRAV